CAKADSVHGHTNGIGTFLQFFPSNPLMARALVNEGEMPSSVSCDMTPRILIADDQPDLLDALKLLLKGQGIEFDAVTSPDAAVRALEARGFELVLRDLR